MIIREFWRVVLVMTSCLLLASCSKVDESIVPPTCNAPISFTLETGRESLNAFLRQSESPSMNGVLLYLDGFPPGRDEDYLGIAEAACEAGWTSLYIQYRGMWESDGNFSIRNSVEDVRTAFRYLQTQPMRPIAIAGYSYSGYGALTVSAEESEVSCVISIDAADLAVRGQEFAENQELLDAFREGGVTQIGPGRPFHALDIDTFLDEHMNLPDSAALQYLANNLVTKHLMLLSSNLEEYSPNRISHYAPLVEALEDVEPASLTHEFVNADHDFTGKHDQVRMLVTNWLNTQCRPVQN